MQHHYSAQQEEHYDSFEDAQSHETVQKEVINRPSAGQKLALAITSLAVLVLLCITIMGFLTNGGKTLLSWPALVLACVLIVTLSCAITAINFIFNYKQL